MINNDGSTKGFVVKETQRLRSIVATTYLVSL
jgi:hypothetical protein